MTREGLFISRALAAAALLATGAAQAQMTPEERLFGVPYLVPPAAVSLDERQREEITVIRRELHDRLCTLSGELLQAQEELRAQMARRPQRDEALREAGRRVAEIRGRMRSALAEAEQTAQQLLTDAQRTALAKWRERRPAGGELEDAPYSVLPGIQPEEPESENLEEPGRRPRY